MTISRKYYKTYIGAWTKSCLCWYEDGDGTAHDIKCEDIPSNAKIYDPDTGKAIEDLYK